MKCTKYVKIRKILRRATEILIIRENIKEASVEMKESAEKKIPRGRKRRGERGAQCLLQIGHAPFPCPKNERFFFSIFRVKIYLFLSVTYFFAVFSVGMVRGGTSAPEKCKKKHSARVNLAKGLAALILGEKCL